MEYVEEILSSFVHTIFIGGGGGALGLEYLHKESSDKEGPKCVKQNAVQILSIQKTQCFHHA